MKSKPGPNREKRKEVDENKKPRHIQYPDEDSMNRERIEDKEKPKEVSMNSNQTQFKKDLKEVYKKHSEIEPLIEGLEGTIPQKSLKDYYIKLQTNVDHHREKRQAGYEKISSSKQEVEVENMFDELPGQRTNGDSIRSKILIFGGAGVGKSTLMRYIAYKWGEGELWNDKFDFVYRVPLKILLNHSWKLGRYNPDDLNNHELKCLVHYNLRSKWDGETELGKIVWPDENNKALNNRILLLLDGYDEVAHLRHDYDFQKILKEVFKFKNIILTSRPNAVTEEFAGKFDRMIENSGLGMEGMNQYLTRYFKEDQEKGKELRDFLDKNSSIREICTIPVNIAMLCFIWAESESNVALQKISSMSDLYGQVVDHLGYRFYTKQGPESAQNHSELKSLWQGGKIKLDELEVLQHVAFKALIGDALDNTNEQRPETLIIPGMIARGDTEGTSVQSSINYLRDKFEKRNLTIESVHKYGLLKTEGFVEKSQKNLYESGLNLQAQNFSFVHLSFQEYLAAQYLVNQLITCPENQKKIADFIASHRNEPRYALILKFMAGILRADASKKDEKLSRAIKIFWDAIVCNPNGALEFGIDAKVNLLMHLLHQAKDSQGNIDERVPNRELMVKFIDYQVLGNLIRMINELKESDYMSANIKENLLQIVLNENYSWDRPVRQKLEKEFDLKLKINSQDAEHEIFIEEEQESRPTLGGGGLSNNYAEESAYAFSSLINHFSREEQEKVVQKLLQNVKNYNKAEEDKIQVCRRRISILTKVFQARKLNPEDSRAFIEILLTTLSDKNLGDISLKGILETVKASDDLSLKDLVREGLRNFKIDPKGENLKTNFESVAQLLELIDCSKDLEILKKVADFGVLVLSHSSKPAREAASRLIELTVDKCGEAEKIKLIEGHFKSLITILSNSEKSRNIECSAIICKLIRNPTIKANNQLFKEYAKTFIPLIKDWTSAEYALYSVLETAESHPQIIQEIIEILIPKLRTSNVEQMEITSSKLLTIARAPGKLNKNLIPDILKELTPALRNSDSQVRQSSLVEMRCFALTGNNSLIYSQVILAFTPLLCDLNEPTREKAVEYTADLIKASKNIAKGDKGLFMKVVSYLVKVFHDSDSSKRKKAKTSLEELPFKCQIDDVRQINEILDCLMSFIKGSNDASQLKIAIKTILSFIREKTFQEEHPQKINQIIKLLKSKLVKKAGPELRSIILVAVSDFESIGGVKNLEKLKESINELNLFLKDSNNDIKRASAKGIYKLLKIIGNADPQLWRNTLENFLFHLQNTDDGESRMILLFYITEFLKKYANLCDEMIPVLIPYFQDSSLDSKNKQKEAIAGVIELMAKCTVPPNIELAKIIISALVRMHRIDDDEDYRISFFIEHLIKIYKNSDSQTVTDLIKILMPYLEIETDIFRGHSCLSELFKNKDSQLFDKVENLLNQKLETASTVPLQIKVLYLRVQLAMMNDDINIEKIQDLLEKLRLHLKNEVAKERRAITVCVLELINKGAHARDFKLDPELVVYLQNFIVKNMNDEVREFRFCRTLMRIVKIQGRENQAFIKDAILALLPFLHDQDSVVREEFLNSFSELLEMYDNGKIELIKEMMETLIPYFDEIQRNRQDRLHNFIHTLCGLLMSQRYPMALGQYLDHSNKNLRQSFRAGVLNYFRDYLTCFEVMERDLLSSKYYAKQLTLDEINEILCKGGLDEAGSVKIGSCLDSLQTHGDDSFEQQIANLKLLIAHEIDMVELRKGIRLVQIAYISIEKSEFSEYEGGKALSDVSWEVINNFIQYLTKEKLQWFHDNYQELAATSQTVHKMVCIKLYHKILADRVITPSEETMITDFVQQGFTTSLTNRGEIIFQGMKYQIKGDDIRFTLERIARVIVNYGSDLLARQYQMHIPLFEKSYKEGDMQEAAVDIRKVPSLVDERIILRSDFWLLTSLKPLNANSELILLEQRSAFGNHIVFKLRGENFEELKDNILNLEEVFGKYQPGLVYSGKLKRLSPLIGQELVKNAWNSRFTDVEGSQVGQTALYYQQELLRQGKEDRILRALMSKQDNPLRALESQLEALDLQQPEKVALQEYYEGFIATFGSVYAVSHVIDSGRFSVEIEADGKFSAIGLFTTLVALIPYGIGEKLSEGIENLAMTVKQNKVKNEAIFMKALAIDAVDLSDRVSKVALVRILKEENRKEILEAKEPDPDGLITKIQELVTKKIEQFKTKAIQVTTIDNLFEKEIQKSPAFRLGQNQANEMIQEWFKFNHTEGNLGLSPEDRRTKFIQSTIAQDNLRLKATMNNVTLDTASLEKPRCGEGCGIF